MAYFKLAVPATCANLGSGFDCVGLAVDIYDHLEVWFNEAAPFENPCEIKGIYTEVPISSDNMVYKLIRNRLNKFNLNDIGFQIRCTNNIPHARGLGSSSAAICSALYAAHYINSQITSTEFSKELIYNEAFEIEGHGDNVAPCIYGGACLVDFQNNKVLNLSDQALFEDLKVIVHIGKMKATTKEARSVLPSQIERTDAVKQAQTSAQLIYAFLKYDNNALYCGTDDFIHQKYRKNVYPLSYNLMKSLREAKIASAISGAGSTLISLFFDNQNASLQNFKDINYTKTTTDFELKEVNLSKGIKNI